MLGYTSDEMKKKTIADITNPNKHEEIFKTFNQVLTEGKSYTEIELLKRTVTLSQPTLTLFYCLMVLYMEVAGILQNVIG